MKTINVPLLRSLNQQLISPQYRTPEEVLAWMGMIQAQNFSIDREHLVAYIWRAENNGLITNGRLRGNHSTYALMDERVPMQEPISREEALRRLARMYWRGHGPATLGDFCWWAGQIVGSVRGGKETRFR